MKGRDHHDTVGEPTAGGKQGEKRAGRARFRAWRGVAVVLGVVLVLFLGGFAAFASHVGRMRTPADVPKADAIIVLTGGQSRLDAAMDLLKAGKGERLLISGVNPLARVDDLRVATGGEKWLFSCCVDIDHEALDTIGNAEESAKWVNANAYGTVILVTNNYHMPRSLLEMHRLVRHARFLPYPVVNTSLDDRGWMTKPDALRVLFTEYAKYLAAIARGILPGRESASDFEVVHATGEGREHDAAQ